MEPMLTPQLGCLWLLSLAKSISELRGGEWQDKGGLIVGVLLVT